jgi:hypothetical protein
MTTGDQVDGTPAVVDTEAGFSAAQVAVDVTVEGSAVQK